MSSNNSWNIKGKVQSARSREHAEKVDLWQSAAASKNNRKPGAQRKKSDKKDFFAPVLEDNQKKIKGKSSWKGITNRYPNNSNNGTWRPAMLHLVEDEEGVALKVLGTDPQDNSLQYSIKPRHLKSTQVRLVDRSLLSRDSILGLYCQSGSGEISSTSFQEPIYLAFSSSEILNMWLVLLRTYTEPEVFGSDSELYRVWRHVHLEILTASHIGVDRTFATSGGYGSINDAENSNGIEATDMDLFCEVLLNEDICARTVTQKGIGNSTWYQTFTFSDLPRLTSLRIHLWQEKRLSNICLGTAMVPVLDCQHGDMIEGWFAVLRESNVRDAHVVQVGDIKLRYKVEEEIVLPQSQYSGLLKVILESKNIFELLNDMEQRLQLKTLATNAIYVAIARESLVNEVKLQADREVDNSLHAHSTLFRGTSILTKAVEKAMMEYGRSWLEASLGEPLRKLCAERVAIETDPDKHTRGAKDQEQNIKLLIEWCNEIWNSIWSARHECPVELRAIFGHVRSLVEKRYKDETSDFQWQVVSAFLFLRFFVPAILKPHIFGLWLGLPSQPVQRSLTLIGKVIQSLANLRSNVQKEEYMRGTKEFLSDNTPRMVKYLLSISSAKEETSQAVSHTRDTVQAARLHIMESIVDQASTLSPLRKESVPPLPHLIDLSVHLALITSTVVRNCKKIDSEVFSHGIKLSSDLPLADLGNFVCQCFEIEAQALQRVNRIARTVSSPLADNYDSRTNVQRRHRGGITGADPWIPRDGDNEAHISLHRSLSTRPYTAPSVAARGKLTRRRPSIEASDHRDVLHRSVTSSQSPRSEGHNFYGALSNGGNSSRSSPNSSNPELSESKRRRAPNLLSFIRK